MPLHPQTAAATRVIATGDLHARLCEFLALSQTCEDIVRISCLMIQRITEIPMVGGPSNSGKALNNPMAGRQVFDLISQLVPFSQALVVSTLPRGSVHIVQPQRIPETMLKSYSRDFHREDRTVWQAILRNQTVRSADVWSANEYQSSPYLHGFLQPH